MKKLSFEDLVGCFKTPRIDGPGRVSAPMSRPKDPDIIKNPPGCSGIRVPREIRPKPVSKQQSIKNERRAAERSRCIAKYVGSRRGR